MGAFNYIAIKGKCPFCNKQSEIICQTHIASDYDGDMNIHRFHDHTYEIGEKMPWFKDDYESWYTHEKWKVSEDTAIEACYSSCSSCKSDVYVLIEFKDVTPVKILEIGKQNEMPQKYS